MKHCDYRSRYHGQRMPHVFTTRERVTAPDGRTVKDQTICSWCGTKKP